MQTRMKLLTEYIDKRRGRVGDEMKKKERGWYGEGGFVNYQICDDTVPGALPTLYCNAPASASAAEIERDAWRPRQGRSSRAWFVKDMFPQQ